jgi:hypothetical protein
MEEANKKQPATLVDAPTLRAAMGAIPNPHRHPQDVPVPEAVNPQRASNTPRTDAVVPRSLFDHTDADYMALVNLAHAMERELAAKNPKPAPTLLGGAPATAPAVGLPGAAGEGPGKVTITTNEAGDCVAVTRTDDEGRILSVLWERGSVHSGYTQP